jgi:uncharacterized NAD-dependent epimerase/dehydratase family protein
MLPVPERPEPAVVFTDGLLARDFAKTCHGLLRGSARFRVVAVLDHEHAGKDAGSVMDGRRLGVPVHASLDAYLDGAPDAYLDGAPEYFIVGVAFSGGRLPESCRGEILGALARGMTVVCGLHQLLGEDAELRAAAERGGGRLVDIRRPRETEDLRFWTGDVLHTHARVLGVLGTDCAVGKRTTGRFLWEMATEAGIRSEMIYTGQTGWMQGYPHGFIFDSTLNDFVSGELERVILECERSAAPDLIIVEGQGALRNPSGPCGSEIILSGNSRRIVLQHAPGRKHFVDQEDLGTLVPGVRDEIDLIRIYGAEVIGVCLNGEGMSQRELDAYHRELQAELGIPVVQPLRDGVAALLPALQSYLGETSG